MRRAFYWFALAINAVGTAFGALVLLATVEKPPRTPDDWFWIAWFLVPVVSLCALIWHPRRSANE